MSNYLAIATVTAALKQILQVAASAAVQGAVVATQRPESAQGQAVPSPTINLYLFQVAPNPAWRNADLPARRAEGSFLNQPLSALDIYYLLTFYGNDSELEPQRLAGNALSALTAHSILTRTDIARIVDPTSAEFVEYLEESDLADQVESVRLSPLSLNLEEMSKLWSIFFQTPYSLSVAYQASVVLIQSEATPQAALPVRARYFYGTTFRQAVIEEVMSAEGKNEPIFAGGALVIRGRNLRGDKTTVALDGEEVEPSSIRDTEVAVALTSPPVPAEVLRAGVHGIQMVHAMDMGVPATPHRGISSNVAAFVLRPTIVTPIAVDNVVIGGDGLRSAELTVQVTPAVGQEQRLLLLLNELTNQSPTSYSFTVPLRAVDTDTFTIAISGVKAGEYLVRVQIDGAESPLEVSADLLNPEYIGPTVTIP